MFELQDDEIIHKEYAYYYGKVTPIYSGRYFKNPQICMFTITLLLTIFLSLLMVSKIFINGWHYWIGRLLCLYIVYLLLTLGFSNPGLAILVYKQQQQQQNIRHQNMNEVCQITTLGSRQGKNCGICQIPIKMNVYHCAICDVCVQNYDHHCIWIGKCIGKNNIGKFKQFICFIFSTLIYALILSVNMAQNVQKIHQ